jgi:hypothetical protein
VSIIVEYKKVRDMKNMKNKKIRIVIVIFAFLIIIFLFIFKNYQNKNPQQVNKDTCRMVEEYIHQNYNMNGNIKASWYTHNSFGITGGLYMYTFKFKNKNGDLVYIHYESNHDLTEKTIEKLEIVER